jgi:tRNA (mo5U34)-methyltransferase
MAGARLLARVDPKFAAELRGERIVFERLRARGFFPESLQGKRVLEIGPKHGEDTALLASLGPAEIVLVDLPEKAARIEEWLPSIPVPTRFLAANLLYMPHDELESLGTFDLVWCLGVLYHNAEQLRLIRRLRKLTVEGGQVAVETHVLARRPFRDANVVQVQWPRPWHGIETITHIPSRRAVRSWLEMAGYGDVEVPPILRARKRAVLTGVARGDAYVGYAASGLNPPYRVGDAT